MPSAIAEASVLLIAGRPAAPIHHAGLEIDASGDTIRVRGAAACALVFTDPPVGLELNDIPQPAGTLALSGVPLTAFRLNTAG